MNIIRWAKWLMLAFLGLLVAIGLVATGCDEGGHGEAVVVHHHHPTATPYAGAECVLAIQFCRGTSPEHQRYRLCSTGKLGGWYGGS